MGFLNIALAAFFLGLLGLFFFRGFAVMAPATYEAATPAAVVLAPAVADGIAGVFVVDDKSGVAIPYVLYEVNGKLQTKALVFDGESTCDGASCTEVIRKYRDLPITVTGTVVSEHIVVRTLSKRDSAAS